MFNLILKDLFLLKKAKIVFILVALGIFNVWNLQSNIGGYIAQILLSVYLATSYVNAYDYKYNAEIIINSLPIKRAQVVISKYLSTFIFLIIAILFTIIPASVFKYLNLFDVNRIMGLNILIMAISLVCLYYSFYFPVYFKLGYMKSRWANWLAMVVVMILGTAIGTIAGMSFDEIPPQSIQDTVNNMTVSLDNIPVWTILAISILIWLISMKISTNIYVNKEL